MTSTLKTSHELQLLEGEAPAVVRVKNLQGTVQGPSDAWGRPNRPQPIYVSVRVCMNKAFGSTSISDELAADTVHYGQLSKAILASLDGFHFQESQDTTKTLSDVLESIWGDLTGWTTLGRPRNDESRKAFLDLSGIRSLQLTAHLPKATLEGGGISLTYLGLFGSASDMESPLESRGRTLKLHDLKVPVLIGVNNNERQAKQSVIANVEVERFDEVADGYCDLEQIVVKTMTDSSFETIEALLADIAANVSSHLTMKYKTPADGGGWHLKIAVEKPIAVPFADAPCVELRINTNNVPRTSTAKAKLQMS